MRAPSNRRGDKEIIADIIKLVEYPSFEKFIRRLINDLRDPIPPFSGNRKENAEFARELRKEIKKLKRMLKAPPSVFLSDRFWSLHPHYDIAFEVNPRTRAYISQEPERLRRFRGELNWIRSRCDEIIKLKLGQHGGVRDQQARAAGAAHIIFEEIANTTGTELRLTCSPTGKFCRLASLLFEAAGGKYNADLRRSCEAIAAR
jgi:hypothetical protein